MRSGTVGETLESDADGRAKGTVAARTGSELAEIELSRSRWAGLGYRVWRRRNARFYLVLRCSCSRTQEHPVASAVSALTHINEERRHRPARKNVQACGSSRGRRARTRGLLAGVPRACPGGLGSWCGVRKNVIHQLALSLARQRLKEYETMTHTSCATRSVVSPFMTKSTSTT